MRAVVQRVLRAEVRVDQQTVAAIDRGLLVLVGVGADDSPADAKWLADKVAHLRVFDDEDGKMNLSVLDTGGSVLAVSQFTLYGDCRRGRRPGFSGAAPPGQGEDLYRRRISELEQMQVAVASGVFQAHMEVELINDGPVTLLLDSKRHF